MIIRMGGKTTAVKQGQIIPFTQDRRLIQMQGSDLAGNAIDVFLTVSDVRSINCALARYARLGLIYNDEKSGGAS